MKARAHVKALVLMAAGTLAGCAVSPTALNSRFAVRQVPYTPDSGSIAIRCGKLIDGLAATPLIDALVVIRDGRVKSVKANASRGDAAAPHVPVMDLSAYTCLPGLIDMHTHLTDRPEDTEKLEVYFSRSAEQTQQQAVENASATLLAGFTTARNVGTYVLGADFELRDTVNDGKAAGPRIQASGPYLTIPHGGGDLYIPDFKEPEDNARFHAGVARGPEQFREKAEMLLAGGADLLKVIASGAVLAFGSEPGAPEMTQEEIAAVVQVAHAQGKKVAAHAHGAASILMAIAAGADTIEHASYLDDAGIAAESFRKRHLIAVFDFLAQNRRLVGDAARGAVDDVDAFGLQYSGEPRTLFRSPSGVVFYRQPHE
jgi:imidazolonepropionase-like amidohydrolase